MNFSEYFTPNAIAIHWEEASANRKPYQGEAYFPSDKKIGLKLDWIKGANGLPVALSASAFDAKSTPRQRGEFEITGTRMPFFRQHYLIDETMRQELLMISESSASMAKSIISRIYNEIGNLIKGAHVTSEIMRTKLLYPENGNMKIDIHENGVHYEYNYDSDGSWKTNNYVALTSTAMWSASDTANPIKDFDNMITKAADVSGSKIAYALMSQGTFNKMVSADSVKKYWISSSGITAGDMTKAQARRTIENITGITIEVNADRYKDISGNTHSFAPDGYVTFVPEGTLGNTWYGTTPAEADLMSGKTDVEVSVVDRGIAITRKIEAEPVAHYIFASEIVLPSYESMNDVFTLKAF